jgi:hypothetical protein
MVNNSFCHVNVCLLIVTLSVVFLEIGGFKQILKQLSPSSFKIKC